MIIMTAIAAGTVYSLVTAGAAGVAGIGIGVLGSKIVQNKKYPEIKEAKKAERKAKKLMHQDNKATATMKDEKIEAAEVINVDPEEIKPVSDNQEVDPKPNPALNLNIDPATGTPVQQ